MSTIGAKAQLQPSAAVSTPATRPIWRAMPLSGCEPACRWVETNVPSSQLPAPPISGFDAISSGTRVLDCA